MMKKEIQHTTGTSKERVYSFIVDFIKNNGFPPTVREICARCGLKSTSTAYDCLEMLEMMGKIEVRRKSPRAIWVLGYEFRKAED